MRKKQDLTTGPLLKQMFLFSLPLIAASLVQNLFSTVNTIVVGQFNGTAAVGAIGTTTSVINLITTAFTGFAAGVGACLSIAMGAKKEKQISEIVHTSMLLGAVLGCLLGVVGFFFSPLILSRMNVDESIYGMAVSYLRIYFLCSPPKLIYNFGFAVMKTRGESRLGLWYIVAAGIANVGFSYLFVGALGMGVVGAALASLVSLTISAVLVVVTMVRYRDVCRLTLRKLRFTGSALADIMRIGFPAGIRGVVFGLSNTMLQASVNSFGSAATVGNTAAGQLGVLLYGVMSGFSASATYFVGQCYGAKKYRRIRQALLVNLALSVGSGLLLGLVTVIFRAPLVALYITDDALAIEYAYQRILIVSMFYFVEGILDCFAASLRGIKVAMVPSIVMIAGICGLRLIWIYIIFPMEAFHSMLGLYLCYPVTWTATALALFVLVLYHLPRRCPLLKGVDAEGEGATGEA